MREHRERHLLETGDAGDPKLKKEEILLPIVLEPLLLLNMGRRINN